MGSEGRYDVVVVGGGHNGLTAAAYLAKAGLSVLVLERLDHVGGAAVSAEAFPGTGVRVSRYSSLVSLLPDSIIADLDLEVELRSRPAASYSPTVREGRNAGLMIEREEGPATAASFQALTGGDSEYAAWREFHAQLRELAGVVAPTLTQPLPRVRELQAAADPDLWRGVVEQPISQLIERRFGDDLVRGVVATGALIGTFAPLDDHTLVQNRCFLYHLIGHGTGEWRVPVGGMGAVTEALEKAALAAGATIRTGAGVRRIEADQEGADGASVIWDDERGEHGVEARYVLANVAPWVLRILLGHKPDPFTKPAGAQLQINFLLHHLPRLRSGADPEQAFAGTFHVAEGYAALGKAYAQAAGGSFPKHPPGELVCHSLTDPSVLGPLQGTGAHTLTYFGLHQPRALFDGDVEAARGDALRWAIRAIDVHLSEPLLSCVMRRPDGSLCLEAKVPHDVEADLGMPGGHIFHGDLSWPWASNREALATAAQQWGVATEVASVLLCGAGARRGGAVSGIAGHNAAQAVLAAR